MGGDALETIKLFVSHLHKSKSSIENQAKQLKMKSKRTSKTKKRKIVFVNEWVKLWDSLAISSFLVFVIIMMFCIFLFYISLSKKFWWLNSHQWTKWKITTIINVRSCLNAYSNCLAPFFGLAEATVNIVYPVCCIPSSTLDLFIFIQTQKMHSFFGCDHHHCQHKNVKYIIPTTTTNEEYIPFSTPFLETKLLFPTWNAPICWRLGFFVCFVASCYWVHFPFLFPHSKKVMFKLIMLEN